MESTLSFDFCDCDLNPVTVSSENPWLLVLSFVGDVDSSTSAVPSAVNSEGTTNHVTIYQISNHFVVFLDDMLPNLFTKKPKTMLIMKHQRLELTSAYAVR